jgi:putative transposase
LANQDKLALIDKKEASISLSRQSILLGLSRGQIYYQPKTSERDIAIMNIIDAIYTEHPCYGKRRMATVLRRDYNIPIGKNHVRTLMIKMGLMAIYPKKKNNLSQPNKQHKIYPYLLRGLSITRANQVWSTDITYIKLEHGFCYLTAIIDWHSRYVVSWELSNTLDIDFCLRALEKAYETAIPEIMNSDQGSHFTSPKFTGISKSKGVKISMDGRGRCLDNIFVERLWRTVKQEDIYLNQYSSMTELKTGLTKFFNDYNNYRPHQSLNNLTPAEVYFGKYKKTAFFQQFTNLNINLNAISAKSTF